MTNLRWRISSALLAILLSLTFISDSVVYAASYKQLQKSSCKAAAVTHLVNLVTGSSYKEADFYSNSSGPSCKSIQGKKFGNYVGEYHTDKNNISKNAQLKAINKALDLNLPIVVEVSGSPQHWVVILYKTNGRYRIADPANGKEMYLDEKYTLGAHDDYGFVALWPQTSKSNTKQTTKPDTSQKQTNVNLLPRYTGSSVSIVDALKSIGAASSFSHRQKLAIANGISDYKGTASQNSKLLSLLKQGQLRKA